MDLPICENHQAGRCPKSQVVLLAEHGPPQAIWYWTFACRTCKGLMIRWNPGLINAARGQALDRELGTLVGRGRKASFADHAKQFIKEQRERFEP